jgi:outer membrane protein assembly factor BamB
MKRGISVCVLAIVYTFFLEHAVPASDWPTYRGDAARSGYTADGLPADLQPQWTYRARHAPRPAWPSSARIHFDLAFQPIIVGDTVLFGSSAEDKVVALDADTGEVRWTFFSAGPIRFAPAAWRDRVFVAGDDGWLYALAIADGNLLWKHRGGPNERMCLGNRRMISRWPARGGPVVFGEVVYYAAGIWPSDGIYLHALDAQTGSVVWTNDETGRMHMPQPHGGANADSGVPPQGYLLATEQRLFVPTGRSVPAAFSRDDGRFEYYLLQENGSIGGSRAMVADRFVINAGCFLGRESGKLAARVGRGVLTATPDGIFRSTGATLFEYRWAELEAPDRKGKMKRYRGLETVGQIKLGEDQESPRQLAATLKKLPALKKLYGTAVRFKEADDSIPKETGLERALSQARPEVESFGLDAGRFQATTYEKSTELIVAGDEVVCGTPGEVAVVDPGTGNIRWRRAVDGTALGLAVAGGRLVVSTTEGAIYCFGDNASKAPAPDVRASGHDTKNDEVAALADEILKKSGAAEGYCVDLSGGSAELAIELAKRSELQVLVVEEDEVKVQEARRRLDALGLGGTRVVVHQADPADPPYPKWFADLVVSSTESSDRVIQRLLRPAGGVACVGKAGRIEVTTRGPLEGAGSWTHQNASPANTICSDDRLIKGPLEMLWYRDGVIEIPDRHAQGPAPLVNQGTLVVLGVDAVCGLDAYNGRTLWEYAVPNVLADQDGVHHDVGVGDTGGNFCLSDESVFVRNDENCLRLDLRSGKKLGEFHTPVADDAKHRNWGYLAYHDGTLFGSVANAEHTVSPRYEGIRLRNESVLLFAMDAVTGEVKWRYEPKGSIRHNAVAISAGRVYLIDRPLAMEDRITRPEPLGKHGPLLKPGEHPGGVLLALDADSGKVIWRQAENVWGTQLAVSEKHDLVVMYYQAVKHGFFKLPSEVGGRLAAFSTATGKRAWDIEAKFVTRPIINGDTLYAEPSAWEIRTGRPVEWNFERSYGCGQISSSTNLFLYRSATLGYHDLTRNVGTENFGGIRPGCWFNAIPAAGLVLVPDGFSKCACSYQMQPWFGLQEKE